MRAAVVDRSGALVAESRRERPHGEPRVLVAAVAQAVAALRSQFQITVVGVAVAGLLDRDRSRVVVGPNLNLAGQPLRGLLRQAIDLPVVLENDANAAAWGECRAVGAGAENLLMVTVGTGLGAGLVIDGNLVRGAFGVSGEIGHLPVVPGGRPCGCGARGCLEQYASGTALRRLAARDGSPLVGPEITAAARRGDPQSVAQLEEIGRWLGIGVATVSAVVDPGLVVIGGGLSAAGELLLEPAKKAMAEARPSCRLPRLRVARLGDHAGAVGAALLALAETARGDHSAEATPPSTSRSVPVM